jgi:hypothetical protein
VAELADIAGAHGNARKQRNQRRLEGVGQHDRLVVARRGQLASQPPPLAEQEISVLEGAQDRLLHLGHAAQQGKRPARRENVQREARMTRVQQLEQRLRQHRVAYPRRAHNENPHGCGPFSGMRDER